MDLRFTRDSEMRAHRERFEDQSAKAQRWMTKRAAAGDYLSIVRSVADCYEPLFRTHPALREQTCALLSLLHAHESADANGEEDDDDDDDVFDKSTMRERKPRYLEGRTKMVEQLAMELLFKGNEHALAVAVYENRCAVSAAIADSGLARNDREARMHVHYRTFYSLAVGAYAALGQHAEAIKAYDDAVALSLWPTVSMNVNYIRALTTLHRLDDAAKAYAHITATDGVQNVFFYRCALFYASVAGDVAVQRDAIAAMRKLRFAVRPVDYVHCMRAFDAHARSGLDASKTPPLSTLSYPDFVANKLAHDSDDDERSAHAAALDVAQNTLALFHDMLEATPALVVTPELGRTLYPRVLAAAVLTGDATGDFATLHRVLALRRTRGNAPLCDDALQSAVTGLLLAQQPHDAWRLVQDELEHTSLRPRVLGTIVGGLVCFLCDQATTDATRLVLAILDDLHRRDAPAGVVANTHVRQVIELLCADRVALADDDALFDVLERHARVFRALDQPFWCAFALTTCLAHGRLETAKRVFQGRDVAAIPTLPLPLASAYMDAFAQARDFELVYRIAQAVNLQHDKCARSDRIRVCVAAMRASREVEWLGRDEAQTIFATHLHDVEATELPDDVQALLA